MQWKKKRRGRGLMKQLNHTKNAQERRKRVPLLIVLVVGTIYVHALRNSKLSKINKVRYQQFFKLISSKAQSWCSFR